MSHPNKDAVIRNLGNSVAIGNARLNRQLDQVIEMVSSQPNAERRKDWGEILKTSELMLYESLIDGQPCDEDSFGSESEMSN